jgi:IS30 family transposase
MSSKLDEAREITLKMRQLERDIITLNNQRRELIRQTWREDHVPQRAIATALGLTNQTVWNEIHRKDDNDGAIAE